MISRRPPRPQRTFTRTDGQHRAVSAQLTVARRIDGDAVGPQAERHRPCFDVEVGERKAFHDMVAVRVKKRQGGTIVGGRKVTWLALLPRFANRLRESEAMSR